MAPAAATAEQRLAHLHRALTRATQSPTCDELFTYRYAHNWPGPGGQERGAGIGRLVVREHLSTWDIIERPSAGQAQEDQRRQYQYNVRIKRIITTRVNHLAGRHFIRHTQTRSSSAAPAHLRVLTSRTAHRGPSRTSRGSGTSGTRARTFLLRGLIPGVAARHAQRHRQRRPRPARSHRCPRTPRNFLLPNLWLAPPRL